MDARSINDLNKLVGKPFKDGARGPDEFDCWGLTMAAMKLFGYELPEFHISAFASAMIDEKIADQRQTWQELPAPQPGCVIIMRFGCQNHVNHIATYIGQGLMLHTREKTGSVIERFNTPVFRALIQGFYLPPEIYKI